MLEKIITDLKKSLPGNSKTKANEDEFDPEEESEDEESSASDKKKAQTSMLIRVVIILGLAYVALDHFILNPDNGPTPEEIMAQAPKKKKAVPPTEVTTEKAPEDKVKEESSAMPEAQPENQTQTIAENPTETPQGIESSTPPVENINILDKNESPVVEAQENIDKRIDQLIETSDQGESKSAVTSPAVEEIFIPSSDPVKADAKAPTKPSMSDLIVEEETFVAPPQYDQIGRGLVYNCKEKFWACVDKPAYVTCNKNMKWNQSKGNSAECVIQNVYSSDEDCAKVQKYNVSTNQATDFCK